MNLFHEFPDAVIAGLLIASACGLMGLWVILKRSVFVGITLSETALCGVALAYLLHIPAMAGALTLTLASVAVVAFPLEGSRLPRDTLLGLMFLLATSGAILLVARSGFGLIEIKALLYGDLILTSRRDLLVLAFVLVPVSLAQLLFARPILYAFLDRDAAWVMGIKVRFWQTFFFVGLGLVISLASKVAGAGLVFCYLIAPPAAALLCTRRLRSALILGIIFSSVSTLIGMSVSFRYDLPSNPTIIVLTVLLPAVIGGLRMIFQNG